MGLRRIDMIMAIKKANNSVGLLALAASNCSCDAVYYLMSSTDSAGGTRSSGVGS